MYLLFSHKLTSEQERDAENSLKIEKFIFLPQCLQDLWSYIPPQIEDLEDYLKPIFDYLNENIKVGDFVLVQGDFGATYKVVNLVKSLNAIAVYATTKRNSVEKVIDGKVVKTSMFKHIRFRKY